ncbi:MAG: energy-coupling factor transporter ATPase, partial [Candidatus Omnitrophota bacterium]|nr:energy-coupling factor transporter ATPase [Candidatus Omnitrophota bacterium]
YPTRGSPTLSGITLDIEKGDFVLVSGPTGCGKTTLLKMLNGIIPHLSKGSLTGELQVAGRDVPSSSMDELTKEVGMIFQNPDDQIVANTVEEEVAFGLENLGLGLDEIAGRVNWALQKTGIRDLKERDTNKLSGGQKQRVVIASQIAMRPKILAFDEPLSQLDPSGAEDVMRCVLSLNKEGITVIMVEHRVADVARYANKMLLMDKGAVVYYGDLRRSFSEAKDAYKKLGVQVPHEAILSLGLGLAEVTFSRDAIGEEISKRFVCAVKPGTNKSFFQDSPQKRDFVSLDGIYFEYIKGAPILNNLSLSFKENQTVALMGANGSGKSTLISIVAGINKPQKGNVRIVNMPATDFKDNLRSLPVGLLIQNPDLMLFCETVEKEMLFGPVHRKVKTPDARNRVEAVAESLDLARHFQDAPFSLSAGQRLRAALGAVLTMQQPVLLLDEPTTGQNQENIIKVMLAVKGMGFIKTLIFCTHDIQTALRYADRILILSKGNVIYDGTPEQVFDDWKTTEYAGLTMPVTAFLSKRCGLERSFYCPTAFLAALKKTEET